MGIIEKIAEIEREMARTQKNKATEYHLGILKAKLAKYRQELLEPAKGGGSSKGEGFDVMKSGDARVALVGFPSVGKSTFLSTVTTTESVAASYEFTTLTCIPGVIEYEGANIQLLDLPGIIEGAAQGKGRGRQVIAVAKTADLILMMLDATKGEIQKTLLEKEREAVGIRLNKRPPNIYFKKKNGGGLKFTHTVPLTHCHEKLIQMDDNGRLFYVKGCINERVSVCDADKPLATSLIRRELPKMDAEELEHLDELSKGKLRHFLLGSPSGYSWTEQVETILTFEESWRHWEGVPTDVKMLPRYKRTVLLEEKRRQALLEQFEEQKRIEEGRKALGGEGEEDKKEEQCQEEEQNGGQEKGGKAVPKRAVAASQN
ncbi:hypothetical protein niasHT_013186 [Heterodera trifolii]|uniref:OBG-type G domain-containing protein n=1 Tax=Heterodera trifolii TaxID=157864 RepID=A0ABD2KTT2_9BILA